MYCGARDDEIPFWLMILMTLINNIHEDLPWIFGVGSSMLETVDRSLRDKCVPCLMRIGKVLRVLRGGEVTTACCVA